MDLAVATGPKERALGELSHAADRAAAGNQQPWIDARVLLTRTRNWIPHCGSATAGYIR